MHKLILAACMAFIPAYAGLPFTLTVEDVTTQFRGAPRIQSFSFAQWKGLWIFVGGRTAGYHATGGAEADFLRAHANRNVWVVDPASEPARVYSADLASLPDSMTVVRDQLSSTAQMSFQDGDTFYVGGGYGQNSSGHWLTYPVLTLIDLPTLVDGVKQGRVPAAAIRFVETPLVQSTGGEMLRLADGFMYVVMGHNFTGSYTAFQGQGEKNRPAVSQEYLEEIRKLRIDAAPGKPPLVTLVEAFRDPAQFHRRDLNVVRYASKEGVGIAAFGGVFTPEQLGWTHPVYLPSGGSPRVDKSFEQKMNGYTCASMLLYDSSRETMYTTFFGGISRHYFDVATSKFVAHPMVGTRSDAVYLDGLQWSDQVSTIAKTPAGTTEFVQPVLLPSFLGSDAVFVPSPGLPRVKDSTEIIDIVGMTGKRVLVGHIYGGIRASPYRFPYTRSSPAYNSGTVPTKASDLVLKVWLELPAR